MICQICHGPDAIETKKAANALPKGVAICRACRQAVTEKQVGITRKADGLSITDARKTCDATTR